MSREKIIDRVKKLLALAGKNSNEAEAAAAAEKAAELIAEHHLSQSELGEKSAMGHDDSFTTNSRPWRRYIGAALARLYFCKYARMYEREKGKASGKDRHLFMGRPDNATVARLMFAYLCVTVDRLASAAARDLAGKENKAAFTTAFKLGCAIRLATRLNDRYEAMQVKPTTTSTGTTLPALADAFAQESREIEAYQEQHFHDDTEHESRQPQASKSNLGLALGYAAGGTIGLDQQLEGDGQRKRLT